MKDFLGYDLRKGDYVAAGGSGNGKAEYGMILYRVEEVSPKLKLLRLRASYPDHKAENTKIDSARVTVTNPNKYVRVDPPPVVLDLFERGVEGTLTSSEKTLMGRWLHGTERQVNLFR